MSHVWHLIRHNLLTHRAMLLAWFGVMLTLPLVALVPWSPTTRTGMGVASALLLQGGRVVLGLVAIAAIVQATSPIDDRAFWRTRPISTRTLAGAHITTVMLVFVLVPTLVVFATAVAFGVPRVHWPGTLVQVAVTEMAIASLGLVVASRTRGVATFIIAALVGLASLYFLVGAMFELRRALAWPGHLQMADPVKGLWGTLGIGALLLPPLFLVAMAGGRRQRAFLSGVLGILVLATSVWFLPSLRFVPPALVDARLRFDAESVTFEPVPGTPGAVAIVLHPIPQGGHSRDSWRFWLDHGQLLTPRGTKRIEATPDGVVPRLPQQSLSVVLAVLTADEARAFAGSRARFVGALRGDVERRITEATAMRASGGSLDTGHLRLSITRLLDDTPDPSRPVRPVVAATEVVMAPWSMSFRHGHTYVLRDRTSGCEVVAQRWEATRALPVALLPTLLPPFTVTRFELAEWLQATCHVDPAHTDVEVRTNEIRAVASVPLSLEFTMPDASPRRDATR